MHGKKSFHFTLLSLDLDGDARGISTAMADFIMTLDSDDEVPMQSPVPSTSRQKKNDKDKNKLKQKQKQAQQQKKQQKKLKKVLDTELSDSGSSEEEDVVVGDGGVGKMDKSFVFDGLGGGFVGDRRNNVWVGTAKLDPLSCSIKLMVANLSTGFGRGLHPREAQRDGESAQYCSSLKQADHVAPRETAPSDGRRNHREESSRARSREIDERNRGTPRRGR